MKTTLEILDELFGEHEPNIDGIRRAMILYAEQAIDRCAETATIDYEKLDHHPSAWREFINKDSILNVKYELK